MRLCVTCVYWTLLLVSVVSSGLLFLIVASEGTVISDKPRGISQEDNIPVENVAGETIGADEIASSEPKIPESNPRPTVKTEREHLRPEEKHDGNTPSQENFVKDTKSERNLDLLKESLTQQPNLSQGISETGQSVVLTLVDTAAAELQSLAEPRLTGDIRPRSSTKNTTLTTTTTRSDATTTAAINLNGESHKFVESHKDTLPGILLETIETSRNFTEGSSKEESGIKEAQSIEDEAPTEQQVVVVRAEQKVADEGPTRIEDVQEDQSKDEARKKEEDSVTSAELDDGAARARIVGGSADEASAAILDGLVTSGPTDHHHEDIPSFSEWAQKRLEEAEKKKTHPNASIQNPGGPGRGVGGMKVRSKNYASPDCGAKIVAVNPEARSARSVLVSTRDEYMLNTCTSRVWFVVELCEAIQAKKIELANFELFSSSPKDFSVHVSDRFPTREWSPVGQFTGKDQRDVQSFHLNPQLFGKFIKVEFHSHYGSEHFCPISLFRAYGTSEFEVLETETDHQDNDDDDDDDEDEDDPLDSESGGDSRNLFGSARDAVLNIVKKAAEVLVKTNDPSNKNNITKIQESIEDNIMRSSFATCMTPRYTINCANCTDLRFAGVFELLSCRSGHLDATLKIPFVNEALNSRELCGFYGVDVVDSPGTRTASLDDETLSKTKFLLARNLRASFLAAIFSPEYVVALCNVVATKDRKLVLNTSYEIVGNVSANSSTRIDGNAGRFDTAEIGGQTRGATSNCSPDVDGGGCKTATLARETKVTRGLGTSVVRQQEPTTSKPTETTTTTMESIAAQIKPTKTLSREDMRKESSVPVLEPSKDPNEESLQAEVMTTPSPILNVPTATTKMSQEPPVGDDTVETTGQIVTPMASVTSGQAGREIQDSAVHEAGHDNGTPMKHEIGDGEIKQGKLDNSDHDTKLTPQEQMSLDSILSDLKDLESDGIHGGNIHNANIVAQPTASTTPQQKESVFLRLSNRIKALERNMSLSGQYLEELSKRYKKQVEEMQRSLERATAAMSEESRKGEERELRRIEEISALRDEINSLTKSMEIILYDRNSWRGKLSTLCQHFALIVVEVVVLILAVSYCRRSSEFDQADVPRATLENGEATRRRSAGAMSASATKKPQTRRPSEIASKIVGTYGDLMIDDRANQETRKDKKKRRKAKTNGDSRKEISRSDEGMPGGTALPSRRSSSIDPPSSSHEKKLALCHSRPRPDSAPEYTGGWLDRPMDLSINEKPEEPEEESPEECSNRQRRPTDGTVVADLPTDVKEEQDGKNRSGIFRTGGILKAAKLPSPSFMKTALGSRMKRNSRENRAGEQSAHLRSDNWEWHSINSSNRSDRSGSESPSGAGATNGHRGNPSDDSGSSSATNTPAGNKRQKKTAGGIRKMTYARDKTQQKGLPPHTTLQRHVKANRNVHIPRFYYPGGKPTPLSQVEATIAKITTAFQSLAGHRATRAQFHTVTKACDLPLYWKVPLFIAAGGDQNGYVDMSTFLDFWKEMTNTHHDAASKFVRIATRGLRNTIIPEDLIPLVQDVVETHPGLTFLKEATEFHSRYVHTVIARIFYCVNRSWSGKISVAELRRSNLLAVISVLEHEEDINQVTAYFSYEHFYVIYCKFWELDRDHDLFIDKMDLTRHNDHALSTRLIERIFSGAVTRGGVKSGGTQQPEDKMSYTEFVWFLLSEEDKNHPTAIEYWFRCMDLDGDGYLSMYELEYFYEEQLHRMEAIGMETLPFEDCLCQMLDMIHPTTPGKISLSDLKKCKMTSIFFDTFFNLEKYLDHEQRDPFASTRDHDADGHELSDWDRFAADEYELLVAEESGNDQNEQMSYENGAEEDALSPNLDALAGTEASTDSTNQTRDVVPAGFEDDPPSGNNHPPKTQNYDSGESDDYAESDN